MRLRFEYLSLCTLLAVLCTGCDGGLMGTGTGPGQQTTTGPGTVKSEVPHLPMKIGPALPRTITGHRALTQIARSQPIPSHVMESAPQEPPAASTDNAMTSDPAQTTSRSWTVIQPSMQAVEATRIEIQEMLSLLDREFDSISSRCETQLLEDQSCVINAGQIKAVYDDSVTRRMIAIYATADAETDLSQLVENTESTWVREIYTALEGTEVEFGTISIQQLNTTEPGFELTVSSDEFLYGRELQLRWDNEYNQITYTIREPDAANEQESYNYRNNLTGQRLTVKRSAAGTGESEFSAVFTTQSSGTGNVLYHGRLDGYHVSGQANDETAYVYSTDFDDDERTHLQEVFDVFGVLISSYECMYESEFWCDESLFEDEFSDYYLTDEEYNAYTSELGFDEIEIVNLPTDVIEFLIVVNDPAIPLLWREEYCDGWQPYPGELEVFCFVDDFAPDDVVVVSIDGAEPKLIPGARVVVHER